MRFKVVTSDAGHQKRLFYWSPLASWFFPNTIGGWVFLDSFYSSNWYKSQRDRGDPEDLMTDDEIIATRAVKYVQQLKSDTTFHTV